MCILDENDEEIVKVILPARLLVGKDATKITGNNVYTVTDEIKIHGMHDIKPDKDILFLVGDNNFINCISADKELLWRATPQEVIEFLEYEYIEEQK